LKSPRAMPDAVEVAETHEATFRSVVPEWCTYVLKNAPDPRLT